MVRIRKKYQGNTIVFGVSTSDAGNVNVRLISLNGEDFHSNRCFHANHINKVIAWLKTVKVNEDFIIRYNVKKRIEPNKPKKRVRIRVKVRMLHLEKYNIVTKSYMRIASSNFANLLRAQMYDATGDYRIVEGGAKWADIDKRQYLQASINGLCIVEQGERATMRGANNKSKALHKANMKQAKVRVKSYKR